MVLKTSMIVARDHPQRPESVYVLAEYPLTNVRRITSKKKHTNIITLVVRAEDSPEAEQSSAVEGTGAPAAKLVAHTLVFEDSTDFVGLLKARLQLLATAGAGNAGPGPADAPATSSELNAPSAVAASELSTTAAADDHASSAAAPSDAAPDQAANV